MARKAFEGLQIMICKSIRSHNITSVLPMECKIIYDLDWHEMYSSIKVVDSTHIVIIPTKELQDAQIREMLHGIVIPWDHVKEGMRFGDWGIYASFAYQNNKGDIFFKLPEMKKQFQFKAHE